MDGPIGAERPVLAPVATQLSPPENHPRMAKVTVSVLRGSAKLSDAQVKRTLNRRQMTVEDEEEGKEVETDGVEHRGIQTPPLSRGGSLTCGTTVERFGQTHEDDEDNHGESDRWQQTPPLQSIVKNGARMNPATRSRPRTGSEENSHLLAEPSLEMKKAWKMQAVERLAKVGEKKSPPVLERSDSDVSMSFVFSLEDLKKRTVERAHIAVVMVQRRARGYTLPLPQRQIHEKRNSIPPGTPDMSKHLRSLYRSLAPNRSPSDPASRRRSSSSSDPLSLKPTYGTHGLIGKLDRSISTSNPLVDLVLPEKVTDNIMQPPSMSAGATMYERRRSVATSLLDVNGSLSYASRKSLRRGSYDGKLIEKPPRPIRVSGSSQGSQASGGGDIRRQSFMSAGRRRGSADVGSLGSSLLYLPGDVLGRRRRSRAPALLAEDVSHFASKHEKRITGLKKFRRAANVVVLCVSMCRKSFLRVEQEKEAYMSFESSSTFLGGQRLMFDPAYFKADRQQRLSEETKRILNLPPEGRTDDLIKYVEIALRNIRAFAQYPKRMQRMLCRVGWLEEYGSKRAILRQGHLPHAFYFILSGEAVVTVLDTKKGKRVAETVAILKRGESFGELAILNRTRRASTVISQDRVELLCISVEDFEDIFMLSGGIKKVNDPDQHAFLTSLTCLKHWPLQLIEKHPKECRFHFFKDGNVLIKDSLFSEWIYIIKSGSCSVLKKLKRIAPSIPSRLKRKTSPLSWNSATGLALPATAISPSESITSLPSKKKKQRRHRTSHTWPDISRRPVARDGPGTAANDTGGGIPGNDAGAGLRGRGQAGCRASGGTVDSSAVSRLGRRALEGNAKRGVYLATARDDSRIASSHKENKMKAKTEHKSDDKRSRESGTPFIQRRREIHSDLDSSRKPIEKTDADLDPMFVVVQVLTKGAVFGLTGVVFSDQPSLSLVSNGAECIVINKKFYFEHATDETLRRLRKEEVPYPSEKELQGKLQQYMNWNAYRHHTFYTTLYESRDHKTERVTVLKPMLYR